MRAWIAALALAGCTSPAPPPPRAAPLPSVAPSAPPPPDPCERAAAARARVPALLDAGKLDRAVRVIQAAASLCPPAAASTRAAEIDALLSLSRVEEARAVAAQVERDAGASAEARAAAARAAAAKPDATPVEALIEAAFVASRAGRAAEARRLFDRAAAAVERASGEKLKLQVRNGYEASAGLPWESNGGIFPHGLSVIDAAPAFSSDGARVAVADGDHILVGDRAARRVRLRLAGHDANITALAWSLDGRRLASASYDGTVRVWDVEAGKSLFSFPIEGAARALRFVRGGSVLVCAEEAAVAWDLGAGREIARATAKGRLIAIDPDGVFTVADDAYAPADRLDLLHGARLLGSAPGAAAYTRDGQLGVLAFRDGIEIRRYPGATLVRRIQAKSRFGGAWISPDGKQVAVGEIEEEYGPIRKVRSFVTATGAALGVTTIKGDDAYGTAWLRGIAPVDEVALDDMSGPAALVPDAIAFAGDGGSVAVLAHQEVGEEWPSRLVIVDARGGPPRDLEGAQITSGIRFAPDRALLGWTSDKILRWSPAGGPPGTLLDAKAKGFSIERASADLTSALVRDKKRWVLLDVASGAELATIPPDLDESPHVISPDGTRLMLGKGKKLSFLDARTGKISAARDLPGTWGTGAFTRDGRSAVVVTNDKSAQAYTLSVATGTLRPLGEPAGGVDILAAVGDHGVLIGVTVPGTSLLGKMRLVDAEQGSVVRELPSKLWETVPGVLSAGDRLLASTSRPEAVVGLWSVETGEPLAALRVLPDRRAAYVYAADGHLEVFGNPADVLHGNAFCQAGARVYPVELCEERFVTQGLLKSLLAGDTAYRDP